MHNRKHLRYASVCSGIEAPTVAWDPIGFIPVFFSEIDLFASAVLSHHYPDVPNRGDMNEFRSWPDADIDVLVGGTPCQSFSIAGLRGGMADSRGQLMLTYLAIAARYRPRWLVWENVPGALSVDDGRAFGTLLGGMAKLGYGFAYRVLDAQYVRTYRFSRAVPQRRRRVFVVGCLGGWRRAAAVLFERESLRGDSPPSREARQGIAGTITSGLGRRSGDDPERGTLVANCLIGGSRTRGGYANDPGTDNFVVHSLTASGFDASEDGSGRGVPLVPMPICFDETQITSPTNRSSPNIGDPCHTLGVGARGPAIAFDCKASGQNGFGVGEVSPTLRAMGAKDGNNNAGGQVAVMQRWRVRRLTPRECERLMGLPDDYTLIPYRGRLAKDGPRYKAIGNSIAVNQLHWIGARMARVDAMRVAA